MPFGGRGRGQTCVGPRNLVLEGLLIPRKGAFKGEMCRVTVKYTDCEQIMVMVIVNVDL